MELGDLARFRWCTLPCDQLLGAETCLAWQTLMKTLLSSSPAVFITNLRTTPA